VRFEPAGPRLLARLGRIPAEALAAVPAGSRVELVTYQSDSMAAPEIGRARFRGVTRGQGPGAVWLVQAAYPPVPAETLRSALRLAAAAEDESRLALDRPDEAARVLEVFLAEFKYLLQTFRADGGNTAVADGAEIRLKEPDETVVHFLAVTAFRQRYAGVWPMAPKDEDETDDD
jgi:hypothetical protein